MDKLESSDELKEAHHFYSKMRERDAFLYQVQNEFSSLIYDLTGVFPHNNGSFGLWLNHDVSDLDLAIGVPDSDRQRVTDILSGAGEFVGVRRSTPDSVRHVYKFERQDIAIDLGVLPPRDFEWTVQGMNLCREGMTLVERVSHVWIKKELLKQGRKQEYATFKLKPYQQYFNPHFLFVPILDTLLSANAGIDRNLPIMRAS